MWNVNWRLRNREMKWWTSCGQHSEKWLEWTIRRRRTRKTRNRKPIWLCWIRWTTVPMLHWLNSMPMIFESDRMVNNCVWFDSTLFYSKYLYLLYSHLNIASVLFSWKWILVNKIGSRNQVNLSCPSMRDESCKHVRRLPSEHCHREWRWRGGSNEEKDCRNDSSARLIS